MSGWGAGTRLWIRAASTRRGAGLVGLALLLAACAPAAPTPTPAPAPPARPTATAEQPRPTPAATATSAPKPTAEPAKPAAQPEPKAVRDFYTGKTVRVVVGSAPGGGYDTYARAIGRHLSRHIPGEPTVIVENMAGAGSLIAANHVYRAADKDGATIGHIQGGLFLQQVLGLPGIEFDALQWRVLGVPAADENTCVVTRQTGVTSLADLRNPNGKRIIVGGNAPGSATWDVANRLRVALDLNLKIIEGYDGTSKLRLAMEQGELDGVCGWGYASLRSTGWDRVQTGEWVVIGQVTESPLRDLERVPLALEFATTDEAKQLIRLGIIVPGKILRPFVVSPDVPPERVAALRQAFVATMADPEFLKDAQKAQLELDPRSGEEVEQAIRDLFTMPDNLKSTLKQINDRKL